MTDPDLIRLFIEPLEALEIPYLITGGVASVIYGDPRFTRDIDVVLELSRADAGRLASGFDPEMYYVPPVEVLEDAANRPRGGHFNLIHGETALRADVYVKGDDPLHAWAFDRRLRLPVEGMSIWVAPVEYVIIRKLEYYRMSGSERHLRDVAMILRISAASVDALALGRWIDTLDLREVLEAAERYEPLV